MNPQDCRRELSEMLSDHIERIDAARTLLDELKDAIAENRVERLEAALSAPESRLAAIEEIEPQRHALLQRYGFGSDQAGFDACIAGCDENDELASLQLSLSDSLAALQHSIQLNHLLVNKGQDRIRRSLGILTGHGSGGPDKTYSRSGKADSADGRRDIAVA